MVPRPKIMGIPEIIVSRILMFMWCFGALVELGWFEFVSTREIAVQVLQRTPLFDGDHVH